MQEVVGAFKDSSSPKKIQTSGIHIAGQKYFVIRADDESIYGKQVSQCCRRRIAWNAGQKEYQDVRASANSLHRAKKAS